MEVRERAIEGGRRGKGAAGGVVGEGGPELGSSSFSL